MTTPRETLVAYLRDAYAMEQEALSILDRQIQRAGSQPHLADRLRRHRDETEHQAERLEAALHRMGADTSALKTMGAKLSGFVQAALTGMADDEVVKDLMAAYTYEQWEAVNYRIIAVVAEEAGEPEVRRLAEESLAEELAMAEWLDGQVAPVTRAYLARSGGNEGVLTA
ncbi:ferritin-like domain-containing protein [Aerophototrophica crusticola]|uniref:Ferritin-like domain-containing protein n=1 Tax=Aerophototrophica crusticola TaxID=1709002 RepID=A0A858R6Z4_9PROT|nr:ferritin-like domain-containing protein [Rhodospirillaceae bacterium B3]